MVEPSKKMVRKRNVRARRGQALVEFALVVPLLLLILYGIVQLGFLLNGFITVQEAARIGVRAASLGQGPNAVESAINSQIGSGFGMVSQGTVPSYPNPYVTGSSTTKQLLLEVYTTNASSTSTSSLKEITVGVSYDYHMFFPFFGHIYIPIHQSYTMAQEDTAANSFKSSSKSSPYIGDAQESGADSN